MNFKQFYKQRTVEEALHSKIKDTGFYSDYLRNKGWSVIGSGARGIVFDKPNKKYVLKLYRNDYCYNIFLDFIEKNQNNPYLVKIQRRIVSGDTGLVSIEKLKPIAYSDWRDSLVSSLGGYLEKIDIKDKSFEDVLELVKDIIKNKYTDSLNDDSMYKVNDPNITEDEKNKRLKKDQKFKKSYFSSIKRLDYFIESYLPALKTMYDLKKYLIENGGSACYIDTHLGNFMIRPSTGEIVITDPTI